MKFLLLKSVWQKNSFYREAIGFIIMCRVTYFKKAAQTKQKQKNKMLFIGTFVE